MIGYNAAHISPAGLGLGPKLPRICYVTRFVSMFLSVCVKNAKYNKKVNVVPVAQRKIAMHSGSVSNS